MSRPAGTEVARTLRFRAEAKARDEARKAAVKAAKAADTSHLTGITYAAVQTHRADGPRGARIHVIDGNGRTSIFRDIDESLGLVQQHYQALVAHVAGEISIARDYIPGYLDPGTIDQTGQVKGQTLVWVLR